MQMTEEQSEIVGRFFQLNTQEKRWLQTIPYKNTTNGTIPSDPLLYRLHEVIKSKRIFNQFLICYNQQALGVYGSALKEIIHEEFGDGIMSAIDFSIKVEREHDPAGDRCKLIWSGKFLPYKEF